MMYTAVRMQEVQSCRLFEDFSRKAYISGLISGQNDTHGCVYRIFSSVLLLYCGKVRRKKWQPARK